MEQTARLAMPLLVAGQSQKELFHNEAIERIAMLLCPAVQGPPLASPPASPATGACYLVGTSATSAWAGQDGALACYTAGGWRFIAAAEGMSVFDLASGRALVRRDGVWESGIARVSRIEIDGETVVRERQPALADPTGGAVIDAECRAALTQLLQRLRTHGLIG